VVFFFGRIGKNKPRRGGARAVVAVVRKGVGVVLGKVAEALGGRVGRKGGRVGVRALRWLGVLIVVSGKRRRRTGGVRVVALTVVVLALKALGMAVPPEKRAR